MALEYDRLNLLLNALNLNTVVETKHDHTRFG